MINSFLSLRQNRNMRAVLFYVASNLDAHILGIDTLVDLPAYFYLISYISCNICALCLR